MTLVNTINTLGISAFGVSMPLLSPSWTSNDASDDSPVPTLDDNAMSLSLGAGTWRAPIAGVLRRIAESTIDEPLQQPTGVMTTGPGLLLTVYPQQYLRLSRLYAQVIEAQSAARPERARGLPLRPVPHYFFFKGPVDAADQSGVVEAHDEIGQSGTLTIYDERGLPIDPLFVADSFRAIMAAHEILQQRDVGDAFDSPPAIAQMITSLAGSPVVRVHLSTPAGKSFNGANLSGLTSVSTANGLFSLDASAGSGSDLTGQIAKDAASDSFKAEQRRLLMIGPATNGRMGDTFAPAALQAGVTLTRDFFSVRVVQLQSFLQGTPAAEFIGTQAERRAPIRIHEPLNLLTDGNDVVAAAGLALSGSTDESLAVAQSIKGDFGVAGQPGDDAQWPQFPAAADSPADAGTLEVNLRNEFAPTAQYFDDGDASTANVDVVFTLNGLPSDASVRAYPRKFVSDAREARGDGRGGIVPASGTLTLLLKDPFELRRPGLADSAIQVPIPATLRCDVMIVKRTGEARLYGNVDAQITDSTSTPVPVSGGTNQFTSADRRGVSNSGVLGLETHVGSLPSEPLDVLLALAGEDNPRDASRWPTMARRDLLVAGLAGGNWRGVIAGGRLAREAHSAQPRLGSPGGQGGRETQVIGASSQNGRLASDIARMAFRRTTNIVSRMIDLADDNWNLPAQPTTLPAGTPANQNSGTFAGSVLQSIAPRCESPELSLLRSVVESNLSSIPTNFADLADFLITQITSIVPSGLPFRSQIINALNGLKTNPSVVGGVAERLFDELRRELMSSCFGRRDTQWALQNAISSARELIYIESPGYSSTQRTYEPSETAPPFAVDLHQQIANRMAEVPGLRLIICTPKHPDFAAGYEPMASHEAHDRRTRILDLHESQTVSFHPVGFPGRPSRLESTAVIVDDNWALLGSSTFRRRGLTFDGSSDLVFTDLELVRGRSSSLTSFRRELMASRLGIAISNDPHVIPDSNLIRLDNPSDAFRVVRERLVADGLGKIERLWNGRLIPSVPPIDPDSVSIDLANPDGLEFSLLDALAIAAISDLNAF